MKTSIVRTATALFTSLILCSAASAFQPHSGAWFSSEEPGSGYTIDIQNGMLELGVYSYEPGGHSQWYLSAAMLTNTGHTFTATLNKFINGQCISCAYTGGPVLLGDDGTITINFTSEMSADVIFPGGRTATIIPWNFNAGVPPTGLYGEWVFVYDIGSTTFAERFNFSTNLGATSNGNGLAYDPGRFAACELQIVGSVAGTVLCADLTSTGALQNLYAFRYGLDETYGGIYIFPPSGNGYTMKGFRIKGSSGAAKIPTMNDELVVSASKAAQEHSAAISAPDTTQQAAFAEIAEALRAALR